MESSKPIIVVDDEESIRNTVRDVLEDEGYNIILASNPDEFWKEVSEVDPSLILLDIWLPGANGIEILKTFKNRMPDVPVIMMSGHAGIDTAVHAIKLGAYDFLEKPVQLDLLLGKVSRAVKVEIENDNQELPSDMGMEIVQLEEERRPGEAIIRKSKITQKTLRHDVVLNGTGLLSGRDTGMILSPLGPDEGIVFQSLDGGIIKGHITSLENYRSSLTGGGTFAANSTVLTNGKEHVRTVEHILAVLHMYGITNILIKVDEEIPNVDGSALDFCRLIDEAGVISQDVTTDEVVIQERIVIGEEDESQKYLIAEPYDGFEVIMRIDYPEPIMEQKFIFNADKLNFRDEIANARSFNTLENIGMAQQMGKAGKGLINSHIMLHEGKVINTELRHPDEFVRHKILDLIGDVYLLGVPVRGRFIANMTSHGYNQALARRIYLSLSE